jgi:hypothetical protein
MTILLEETIAIGSTVRMFDQDAHVIKIEHTIIDSEPVTLVSVRPPFVFKNSIITTTNSNNLTLVPTEYGELEY